MIAPSSTPSEEAICYAFDSLYGNDPKRNFCIASSDNPSAISFYPNLNPTNAALFLKISESGDPAHPLKLSLTRTEDNLGSVKTSYYFSTAQRVVDLSGAKKVIDRYIKLRQVPHPNADQILTTLAQ